MNLKCLKNQRRLAEFCTMCGEFLEVTVELRPGLRVTVREWAMSAGGVVDPGAYFARVETDPTLRGRPVAVQQDGAVVAANAVPRLSSV